MGNTSSGGDGELGKKRRPNRPTPRFLKRPNRGGGLDDSPGGGLYGSPGGGLYGSPSGSSGGGLYGTPGGTPGDTPGGGLFGTPGGLFGTPVRMEESSDRPAIVFDFDGVLSPIGYVSDRRVFTGESDNSEMIKAKVQKIISTLNILKPTYDLYICSQNQIMNIRTFLTFMGFPDDMFKEIKAQNSYRDREELRRKFGPFEKKPNINKADFVNRLRNAVVHFIDDSRSEFNGISSKVTGHHLDPAWTSQDEDPPVITMLSTFASTTNVTGPGLNLRF